jgi:hypothetical protein
MERKILLARLIGSCMLNSRDQGCTENLELTHFEKGIGRSFMSRLCCKYGKHRNILASGNEMVYICTRWFPNSPSPCQITSESALRTFLLRFEVSRPNNPEARSLIVLLGPRNKLRGEVTLVSMEPNAALCKVYSFSTVNDLASESTSYHECHLVHGERKKVPSPRTLYPRLCAWHTSDMQRIFNLDQFRTKERSYSCLLVVK